MNGLPLLSVWGMNRLWKILPKSVVRLKKTRKNREVWAENR